MGVGIKASRCSPEKVILTKLTSDATATQSNIDKDKTAYINGEKVIGTRTFQTYYTGSGEPSSSLGVDGDIYFVMG